ncbi:hypothetical protein DBIPINDM_007234 (plasmid) [Mesorhizobium sp. AR02]|uniref:hypothetical protein n=1 Tax=Mesorhizobium sp. AR02 TaxID=2865837 RepID=UPI00216026D2|nr:hypothetical protein [Mesorhizobium sp. AR02]UVK49991.1 hypothetical protein DBIPINDM_007234 [Mesorhizobium sp. AR02]
MAHIVDVADFLRFAKSRANPLYRTIRLLDRGCSRSAPLRRTLQLQRVLDYDFDKQLGEPVDKVTLEDPPNVPLHLKVRPLA